METNILVRDKYSCIDGEKGLFFDCSPEEAIKRYSAGDLTGMAKSTCMGAGKYQVASKTAYWKYYIPAKCLFGLWPKNVPISEMEQ